MDFRNQILEDISYYQEERPNIQNIKKDEWAFNYWVLDKLFYEDLDEIENKIIEYSDYGIDCYVWHEESKDLFLIQNKLYDPEASSELSTTYFNKAVEEGYIQLVNGTYKRCPELQQIYNKFRADSDFSVYHYFYVTNEKRSDAVNEAVKAFNSRNFDKHRHAKIFYLNDIQEAYYGEPIVEQKSLSVDLYTLNQGTVLKVNNEAYGLDLPIDATYLMLPVVTLYEALKTAESNHYPIFDANIREYLGVGKSVNKKIRDTLESVEDRKRFFFYNNGITIVCDRTKKTTRKNGRYTYQLTLTNPQIVNGCQTVSTIEHVLDSISGNIDLEDSFKDTFVMARILEIPQDAGNAEEMAELRRNIVRYNNSQNNIDEKTFAAVEDIFRTLQRELKNYGFLLLLKQSDKETFKKQYKKPSNLLDKAAKVLDTFELRESMTKTADFYIPLDRLLQIILAFSGDAQQAFQKKSRLLDKGSPQYSLVTNAIRSPELTTKTLLNLYLLYLKAEKSKKDDRKVPITWYLFEAFSKIECEGGNYSLVDNWLSTSEEINDLVNLYTKVTAYYLKDYTKKHKGKEYNSMIKEKLDMQVIRDGRDILAGF